MTIVTKTMNGAKKSIKAIYAGVAQLIASLVLVTVGDVGLSAITTNQWLVIGGAVLASAGGVWGLTNKT